MYCVKNFPTKKALKEAIGRGELHQIFQPGPFGGVTPTDGRVCLEGPHAPKPHKWYASATLENGYIVKVS